MNSKGQINTLGEQYIGGNASAASSARRAWSLGLLKIAAAVGIGLVIVW